MRRDLLLVSAVGEAQGSAAAAAGLAVAAAGDEGSALMIEMGAARPRRPTLLATAAACELEERLRGSVPGLEIGARGRICHALVRDVSAVGAADDLAVGELVAGLPAGVPCVAHAPAAHFRALLAGQPVARAALLRADLEEERAVTALTVRDLVRRGMRVAVMRRPLGWLAARRALAGSPAGTDHARLRRLASRLRAGEGGQSLPLVLGAVAALLATAVALVSIAGALTGAARGQRAADLVAISAARSMRDDLPRLLAPARLPDGSPNPRHLDRAAYLARARTAGRRAAAANGVGPGRVSIGFPDREAFPPLRARAEIRPALDLEGASADVRPAVAVAEAAPPAAAGAMPVTATGGGYSGALVYRQGEGMRPDVGAAFDRMAAAARSAGLALVVNSGFRSDAEQAALFAANPDPRWVAPPGHSLHRCATELDLGPPGAYGWLAANSGRFGFVKRYSWESWHFGFDAGPPPCSAAGNAVLGAGDDGVVSGSLGLPAFVPARFRTALQRSAARWNVSGGLLAAQLLAESGFDPGAVSPAGAQGIAQFIPSTAAAYGLRDPFDPEASIDAQAHLMSDLLRQFGSAALALAAYNAGPAPISACGCVPAIPETIAYVARILALLDGAGVLIAPPFEVRLVA
jgi:hypothetical protein